MSKKLPADTGVDVNKEDQAVRIMEIAWRNIQHNEGLRNILLTIYLTVAGGFFLVLRLVTDAHSAIMSKLLGLTGDGPRIEERGESRVTVQLEVAVTHLEAFEAEKHAVEPIRQAVPSGAGPTITWRETGSR